MKPGRTGPTRCSASACARPASLLAALPPTFGAEPVLGPVDALKLHSCLTLFERVAPEEVVFGALLERWYGGRRDAATLGKLDAG
jgi:uncharacterized protein (DUF1810 family)